MKLIDKFRGNLYYESRFEIFLGKNPKLYIDSFDEVMLKYDKNHVWTISEYPEDIEFYKELLK